MAILRGVQRTPQLDGMHCHGKDNLFDGMVTKGGCHEIITSSK